MAVGSPSSFTTARDGETAFLTPPSTTQTSRNSPASAPPARYRQATQLPFELAHHSSVYLESDLQGYGLLTSLLRSGSSSSPSDRLPAQIPPIQLFELSATLVVYPAATTRATTPDKLQASNAAAKYLRDVNRVVGPVNAGFAKAFVFTGLNSPKSRGWRRRGTLGSPINGDSKRVEDERPIKSAVAQQNSLWAKADDFWRVVGWAFNCSVKYKARWERWKIWLDLMLEIMEDDWKERNILYDEQQDSTASDELLQKSIIVQYLIGANANSLVGRRKLLSAILADGGSKSMSEFKEVFKDELKGKKEESVKPIKEMRLDEGDFGDLGIDPDEDDDIDDADAGNGSALPIRKSGRSTNTNTQDDSISPTDRLGGIDSVRLRQRILAFLPVIAERLPAYFTSREHLFDSYTEYLRPLPAPTFATLIRTSMLPTPAMCVLAANTLLPLFPHSPPVYNLVPPSQDEWAEYFLPYAANTHSFADNAKVTILLQQVVQATLPEMKWSKHWVEQVLKGIRARRKKARGLNKSGGGGIRSDEMVAKEIFKESEQLLLLLVQWVEDDANAPPTERPQRDDLIPKVQAAGSRAGSVSDLSSVPSESEDDSSELEDFGDVEMKD
ncbi:uncharacterized protein LTHEOB_2703 [Lasiodiplodia theobromae]|uniref:uncharacterized protein n=1 Tax=Lasiodiplodia theobromae TaxID=45133 RepID=UPI0015C2CEC9|nr:uncharacterized protein LTHEOB_2703 [Lasiodiplodia theobromae]KAF4534728.1 hypothetical protein LTHEOB_2703 [Lasiodiplodia theobromae]